MLRNLRSAPQRAKEAARAATKAARAAAKARAVKRARLGSPRDSDDSGSLTDYPISDEEVEVPVTRAAVRPVLCVLLQ